MSGYLERIIGRAREELLVVEPVLGSRYEQGPQASGPEEVEVFVGAVSSRADTTPRSAEAAARLRTNVERRPEPARSVSDARARDAHGAPTAAPAPTQQQEAAPRPSVPAQPVEPPERAVEVRGSPATRPTPQAASAAWPTRGVVEPAEPVALRLADREAETRVVTVEGPERTRFEMLEWERVVERIAPSPQMRPTDPVPQRTAEAVERVPRVEPGEPDGRAAPEVRVHIGRIEITAPAAAPPAPVRRARFEPELSLAAYLEERRKPRS